MTERHHYKYVVLDSSKENNNAVTAKFNVQIPHGISNVTRCCVKSFSIPNVFHNVYGGLKTVKFVEFYRPTASAQWIYEVFSFELPEGYDETAALITTMQAKFSNASASEITRESDGSTNVQHVGQTDNPTTVTITHSESTFRNTLVFDSGSQHKAIALFCEDQNVHTIWESLGFSKHKIVKRSELNGIRDRLNQLPAGAGADLITNNALLGQLKFISGCVNTSSIATRTLTSPHAGTHENSNGIYISSKVLGNDTLIGHAHDDSVMVAHQSDVLQFINNEVPKYSYLTYHTDVPMWQILTTNYINHFDIEIRDHKGHLYPRSAIANFVLVLMFETVQEMEYNKDELQAYNALGYRLGHPTSSGFSSR